MIVPSERTPPNTAIDAELEAQRRKLEANAEKLQRKAQETWDAINANVERSRIEAERNGGQ